MEIRCRGLDDESNKLHGHTFITRNVKIEVVALIQAMVNKKN